MSIPIIGFFNNKGGVGKTSLVYHLSWMYSDLGLRVIAADLDPQANLTAAFLDEDRLEELWLKGNHPQTIYGCIQPLLEGIGDITRPHIELVSDIPGQMMLFTEIGLLVGDLQLSQVEDELSDVWSKCLDGNQRAFRVTSAFWRAMQQAGIEHDAQVILMDLGPNLGAINRAALIATDYIVMPLSPDIFSLQGLCNLGPTRRRWYKEWQERLSKKPAEMQLELPSGQMQPVGYVVLQHAVRMDRPVQAYERWIAQIPDEYRKEVLDIQVKSKVSVTDDPNCLALLKHYRNLMPLAQEAHKPIFHLKPADGAIGSHMKAVQEAHQGFEKLARIIAQQTHVILPQ
ncbi:MAG: AAA family ATPase [Ktedonobacteraceae bacterium]